MTQVELFKSIMVSASGLRAQSERMRNSVFKRVWESERDKGSL